MKATATRRQFHDDAIAKLQREHQRLQGRIDAMYDDKLDGRIGNDFFDAKAAEMRAEQAAIMRDLEAHQTANRSYIEEGVQLLELAHRAPVLFESQPPMRETQTPEFRTLELHLEGRRTHREISATL